MYFDISNIEEQVQTIKENFSFTYPLSGSDHYHCSCGHHFNVEQNENSITDEDVEKTLGEDEYLEEFKNMMGDVKLGLMDEVFCPSCNKNFLSPETKKYVVRKDEFFASGYFNKVEDDKISLLFWKLKYEHNDSCEFFPMIEYKAISLYKTDNRITLTNYDGSEVEVPLEEVPATLSSFLNNNIQIIFSLEHIHFFINDIAGLISDANNINLVQEVLVNLRGRVNDAGFDEINKILVIFFAIFKYSNFSTIALTKGPSFLFELLTSCKIPTAKELQEAQATSPVRIFNFIVKNYMQKVSEELKGEDRTSKDFIFRSKTVMEEIITKDENNKEVSELLVGEGEEEREMLIKVRNQKAFDELKAQLGAVKKKGDFSIDDFTTEGSISKFVFKTIRTFSDYQKIVRYFKFYDIHGLIQLIQKWPLDFLVNAVELIYHRQKLDDREIQQIFRILDSYTLQKAKEKAIVDENGVMSYEKDYACLRSFDFKFYDDAIICLDYLKKVMPPEEQPNFERSKAFDKIRDFERLVKFHDNINKQRRFFEQSGENADAVKKAVEKYFYLEERGDYEGPLKVKILETVEDFIKEGHEMNHSGAVYVNEVLEGEYLVGKLVDTTSGLDRKEKVRFTIGFRIDYYDGLIFDQLKGVHNELASDRVKKLVRDWLQAKGINLTNLNDVRFMGDGTLASEDML